MCVYLRACVLEDRYFRVYVCVCVYIWGYWGDCVSFRRSLSQGLCVFQRGLVFECVYVWVCVCSIGHVCVYLRVCVF